MEKVSISPFSMISNSVTHLRSYTNKAITNIAKNSVPISPITPHERRCQRAEVSAQRADIVAWNDQCSKMFHNVLRVFHNVLLVVHDDLVVVHNVSRCITMFYKFTCVL